MGLNRLHVTKANLAAGAVTAEAIGTGGVGTAELEDGSIALVDLADGAVGPGKLADGARVLAFGGRNDGLSGTPRNSVQSFSLWGSQGVQEPADPFPNLPNPAGYEARVVIGVFDVSQNNLDNPSTLALGPHDDTANPLASASTVTYNAGQTGRLEGSVGTWTALDDARLLAMVEAAGGTVGDTLTLRSWAGLMEIRKVP